MTKHNKTKLKESKWRVTLMTAAPQVQSIERIVDAPDEASAVRRAESFFPNLKFINTQVTALDPQTNTPTQAASPNTQNPLGQMPAQAGFAGPVRPSRVGEAIAASVSLPYMIMLPNAYRKLLAETSPVKAIEYNNRQRIEFYEEADLRVFVENLLARPESILAELILSGIRRSMS